MTDSKQIQPYKKALGRKDRDAQPDGRRPGRAKLFGAWALLSIVLLISAGAWLVYKASIISEALSEASRLIPELKEQVAANDKARAMESAREFQARSATAKDASEDPLWALASALPGLGANFSAVSEVARSADDVATLAVVPLVNVFDSLNWDALVPTASGANLEPVKAASPSVSSGAHAVRASAERLEEIDVGYLLPQVAEPLISARHQLAEVTDALTAAADASRIIPAMLGADDQRTYLLMIQNNAELRASGGIPGALATLTLSNGRLTLGAQASAGDIGVISPAVPVNIEQQQIYTDRLGKFMQDVNLTPDFPTAAGTAQAMWEQKSGQKVAGVISVDPIALSYILDATGPVMITDPDLTALMGRKLPIELSGQNVVRTLLSDVYLEIEDPRLQDAFFASVAKEIFSALASGKNDTKGLLEGISRGVHEGRVLVWADDAAEQAVIGKYAVSGSVAGPSVSPARFDIYFNDGTGAKMDYYVKRTVQLVKECTRDGYEQTTVRINSTNNAPANAATELPPYVTGNGNFGVPAGSVQTNIVAYGPAQANVENARLDGHRVPFAPYLHSNRPVGVVAVRLTPGETSTVEFTFGKIVQHTEPNLVVTPTVQPVKDVTLPTEFAACG